MPDNLRTRLVDAGVRLLESEGQGGLTIRAVTREAGVSHGAPRRYFPTLSALSAAVARVGLVDMGAALHRAALQTMSPQEALHAIADAYVDFAAQRPAMFALIFRHDLLEGSGENLRLASRPLFEALIAAVDAVAPENPQFTALRLWTSVHGIAALNSTRAFEPITDLSAVTELTRRAVRDVIADATEPGT
ncbi:MULTISPECIES: TetR/AcrR family transcriptional regulator [unclassified Rhodococcus (in: high G+C Gram-positive bacteria)]|uniref:TetR/AcrR family transcriptional regulator n=1 Tax=unclassified Rhodococcus (in: high G+C Gram-positive bacteria) TaxID=192944 RepID=UPI001F310C17|nr:MULTISPECIES: TetR/AcrR family transcriptional regulator [unclassified Rhodococcus (in: high G+C Gram-positive bacteria)]